MTTYIARFCAFHKRIPLEQTSIFTWKQESGEIDAEMLTGKIKRESSLHFYRLASDDVIPIDLEDITIEILNTEPFCG